MIVIPAIDIKNGKCVRLLQGRMDAETVFSDDPPAMGRRWEEEGAELIHVVDLDGAVDKRPINLDIIRQIIDRVNVPIQVGGGIRDIETVRMYMAQGVSRVVIGTEAIKNPDLVKTACREFPDRIVVGIDAMGGKVAIEGWTETTETTAVELARQFEGCGVAAINFTDIERDGMRSGPNLKETEKLALSISIPVVASGGVSSIEDIKNLTPLAFSGVVGVITGRALYDGSLDLKAAIGVFNTSLDKMTGHR
ncbi:MAG: 1-(5-phosphoribosyl)-5-[(5-phosphoribosylamino)methylideneamino]imidazole-4-carboxamide isomerase [Desulfobacteraceae bacterium]|nr:1-(5-phosphoribosyl)-5-[(5-phosphoribosylamino)methylideneamino]imidazole-4-carboxamide isomerase [Desulfobacteraceae bacterium]